jgi:hypothetical protein
LIVALWRYWKRFGRKMPGGHQKRVAFIFFEYLKDLCAPGFGDCGRV